MHLAFRRDAAPKGRGILCKMLVLILLIAYLVPVNARQIYGYTAVRGTVTTKSGKVRKDASTSSPFVFGVTKGESVIVIGEKKGSDGKLWYQIKVLDSVGYIRSDLVQKSNTVVKGESTITVEDDENKPSDSSTENNGSQTQESNTSANQDSQGNGTSIPTVKGSNVIVREEPSTKANIKTVVQNGQPLAIINVTDKDATGYTWSYVSFSQKNTVFKGYIRSDLINLNKSSASDSNSGNQGTSESSLVGGTVSGSELTLSKPIVGKIKGMGVNIRKEPVDGKVVGKLSTGSAITCTKQKYSEKDGKVWLAVSFVYNKKPGTGYVRSDFTDGIAISDSIINNNTENNGTDNTNSHNEDNTDGDSDIQASASASSESSASIKGTGVRVREKAVNGNIICQLDTGYPIEIIEETDAGDGYKWYKVRFSKNDTEREGYVRSDLVSVITSNYQSALSDEDFERQIQELPESYKPSLRALHEKHPNWQFVPVNTGLDWNDTVTAESRVGKNLVSKSSIASWKSTQPQAYDWTNNVWYGFDGGSWASASTELIQYYLDPRNFLDESGIFQFETVGFEDYQSIEGVQKLLANTFMSGKYTDADGMERSYAETFYEAGKAYGISPYHLAARAVQEQGIKGTSQSIAGNVAGLENLFNYFNIGAYATAGTTATINGLYYAAQSDEAYLRPWNTRYRSIAGSAKYISDKYVALGQNTLYFQKFNVVNSKSGYYSHQYMSNIVAASSESARLKNAHNDLNVRLVFRIPYYKNMPSAKCVKPTSDSNPNTYLKNLWVEGYSFTTPFSSVTGVYYLQVDPSVESVNVGAETVSGSSSISGTGTVWLNQGENKVQVTCKAQNGATKIYTINIKR